MATRTVDETLLLEKSSISHFDKNGRVKIDRLRLYFDFDLSKGHLFWKARGPEMFGASGYSLSHRSWNTRYAGKEALASYDSRGYKIGHLRGRLYSAHRVLWALAHKEWANQIDHINGVRCDNRIANLRNVTPAENGKNRRLSKMNTSGVTGVYWNVKIGKWAASIVVNGATNHLGYFTCIDDARLVRLEAEKMAGFHRNHGTILSTEEIS
jgi:hypothetical protein